MGKDGEPNSMIFLELRASEGLSWMLWHLEDSVQDEMANEDTPAESHGADYMRLECEN